jgi:long-chain acyl-CoA synthetase
VSVTLPSAGPDSFVYDSPLPYPGNLCRLLDRAADLYPGRRAIGFLPDGGFLHYAEFLDRTCRMAHALERLGVRRGDRVVISARNSCAYLCAALAVFRLGAVLVPTNPIIRHYELAHILAETRPRLVFCESLHLQWVVQAFREARVPMPPLVTLDGREEVATFVEDLDFSVSRRACADADPDETAMIVYTAAMEGHALGARLSHGALFHDAACCAAACFNLARSEEETVLTVLPLFHLHGFSSGFLSPLCGGVTAVPLNPSHGACEVVEIMGRLGVTQAATVPVVLYALGPPLRERPDVCARLRNLVSGGIAAPADLLAEYRDRLGIVIREGYGLTECSPTVTWCAFGTPAKPGTVGRSLPCCEVRVADAEGRPLPAGEEGEICVRGANLFSGYHRRPEHTRSVLRDGWFRTGDLGRLDPEGYLTITGLCKDMLNLYGLKVYPREVERILGRHPGVSDVRVYAEHSERFGCRVACDVRLKAGCTLTEASFRTWCRHSLSAYKIPRTVRFVH